MENDWQQLHNLSQIGDIFSRREKYISIKNKKGLRGTFKNYQDTIRSWESEESGGDEKRVGKEFNLPSCG